MKISASHRSFVNDSSEGYHFSQEIPTCACNSVAGLSGLLFSPLRGMRSADDLNLIPGKDFHETAKNRSQWGKWGNGYEILQAQNILA